MVGITCDFTIKSHRDDRKIFDKSGENTISRSGEVSFDRNVRLNLVPEEFIKSITLKNYSPNTIRTYKSMMQEFLEYYRKLDPGKITDEQIRDYLTDNLKHKAILSLIYSAGLRRGELINMKINDIDSKRMYVIVRQGKGRKDRYSILSALFRDPFAGERDGYPVHPGVAWSSEFKDD
jgi:integrase